MVIRNNGVFNIIFRINNFFYIAEKAVPQS
jgi:hypothetical protein